MTCIRRFRLYPRGLLLFIAITLVCSSQIFSQSGYRDELKPYVDFLSHDKTSAKDYVLRLFDDHDLVILCERAHPDITQYNLFLSIVSDPRFINSVGNIFTEIGISTQSPEINEFLHAEHLPADSIDRAVIRFQRNCSFYPMWENYNYSYLIHGLYTLNQNLPEDRKVNLFNSDLPFDWNTMNEAALKDFWNHLDARDSIIAYQIIQRFDEIRNSPGRDHKALIIMNYRHAFGHDFEKAAGVKRKNAGTYLFERYGDAVANVYVNFVALRDVRSDNDMAFAAIQDGKWDASFKALNIEDAGFDFRNSPFGKDTFDIWPARVNCTYQDVFDGFVFYLPLEEHKYTIGMPGLIDSTFGEELLRRFALYSTLPGGRFKSVSASDVEEMKTRYNKTEEQSVDMLDSLRVQINKWVKE